MPLSEIITFPEAPRTHKMFPTITAMKVGSL